MEELHQNFGRFVDGPGQIGCRGVAPGIGERRLQNIGEFVDMGDAAVETQLFDVLGDPGQRAVGRLAQADRRAEKLPAVSSAPQPRGRPPRAPAAIAAGRSATRPGRPPRSRSRRVRAANPRA